MRLLDEKETAAVFEKLFKFFGANLKHMVDNFYKNRIYYGSEGIVCRTTSVAWGCLVSLATCIQKFTKGGSFWLTVQALDLLAAHARRKVCVMETSEKSLTSGGHVLKVDLSRISENVAAGEGVVVFSSSNVPLAFGIAAKSAQDF